ELWHKSGHYDNYKENMYFTRIDEREFAVKPMNCPASAFIYGAALRSYRDLPLRLADFGRLHRYERSGATHGLTRVRTFCQDDAHIYCTPEQIDGEISALIEMILDTYQIFGFEDVRIELSTRPEKSIGSDEIWERSEKALAEALEKKGISFRVNPGDGAFYGPKIDFHVLDALDRSWQLGTIQLDFSLPERFDLNYTAPSGAEARPVVIHRAILGSIERFMGILIEHCAGAFPLWLAPLQAIVLPIADRHHPYAREVAAQLGAFRIKVDERSEKVQHKIRDAEVKKIPYMLVVGDQEVDAGTVSVRSYFEGRLGTMPVAALADRMGDEVTRRLRRRVTKQR
ncbi:MAG: threonine--tRNA ligase, partial [Deltaproteobacteria bacterium]